MASITFGGDTVTFGGDTITFGEDAVPELTNPQNTPEPDGATLTIESNSDLGTLYSYSKTTPFTGTDEENAAEIIANGVGQAPVVGTNTRVVTGQDQLTDYYVGWVQDSAAGYTDILTDISEWTFARASTQLGLTEDRQQFISSAPNVPAYDESVGVLLEPETTNIFVSDGSAATQPVNSKLMGPRTMGDIPFTRWESTSATPSWRRFTAGGTAVEAGETYCSSVLVIPEEERTVGLQLFNGSSTVGRVVYNLDDLVPQVALGGNFGAIPIGNAFLVYCSAVLANATAAAYLYQGWYTSSTVVPVGDGFMYGSWMFEKGTYPSSRMINTSINAVRNATSATQSLSDMGLNDITNNACGHFIVKTNTNMFVELGVRPLLRIGTGDNQIAITLDKTTATLTKTVATVDHIAQVTNLEYRAEEPIYISWRVADTGMKLWVNGATATDTNAEGFAAPLTAVTLDPGLVTAKYIRVVDEALDDADIEAWPSGRSYYVSAAGNDANGGTGDSDAFETLAHVNSLTLNPGDTVYLRSGDTFYGQLLITDSGTKNLPITVKSYGVGTKLAGDGTMAIVDRSALYDNWTSHYDNGGVKIWVAHGSELGASVRPRGLTQQGIRVPSNYNNLYEPEDPINGLVFDETAQHGGTDNFYYRRDTGAPVDTWLGVYDSAITVTGSNVIVESIHFRGPSGAIDSQTRAALVQAAGTAENVTFQYCVATQSNKTGISSGNDNVMTTVRGCKAYDLGTTGLYLTGHSDVFVDNTVYDIAQYEGDIDGDRGGIGAQYGSGPKIITGNRIYNIGRPDNAVDFHISCFDMTSEYTITHNNLFDGHCGGIQIHHTTLNEDAHLVAFNVIRNTGKSTAVGLPAGKLAAIRVLSCINTRVFNNTISDVGAQGIFMRYRADNVQIKNNIIEETGEYQLYVYSGTTLVANDFDYNNYYRADFTNAWSYAGAQYSTLLSYQTASGQEASSIDTDPVFEQLAPVTNWDVNIQVTSPAKDAGTDWWSPDPAPTDMNGNTVVDCMGAFEE